MKSLLPPALQPYFPFISHLVLGILILLFGWLAAGILSRLTLRVLQRQAFDVALGRFVSRVVRYALIIATVIASLGTVGVRTTSLIALLASAGLAVGLALQGNLSHLASGVVLMLVRPFSLGDTVIAAGQTGRVEDMGLFATTIISASNEQIMLPNSKITGDAITNLTVLGVRRGTIDLAFPYGVNLAEVETLVMQVLADFEGVRKEPAAPSCAVSAGGGGCTLSVSIWCASTDFGDVVPGARRALYEALTAAEIALK
jgi:small conductance mechanosensitive channel